MDSMLGFAVGISAATEAAPRLLAFARGNAADLGLLVVIWALVVVFGTFCVGSWSKGGSR